MCWDQIGIVEKNMEATNYSIIGCIYRDYIGIMEKKMELGLLSSWCLFGKGNQTLTIDPFPVVGNIVRSCAWVCVVQDSFHRG